MCLILVRTYTVHSKLLYRITFRLRRARNFPRKTRGRPCVRCRTIRFRNRQAPPSSRHRSFRGFFRRGQSRVKFSRPDPSSRPIESVVSAYLFSFGFFFLYQTSIPSPRLIVQFSRVIVNRRVRLGMSKKKDQEKRSQWSWADSVHPKDIDDGHVLKAYRIGVSKCKPLSCR